MSCFDDLGDKLVDMISGYAGGEIKLKAEGVVELAGVEVINGIDTGI